MKATLIIIGTDEFDILRTKASIAADDVFEVQIVARSPLDVTPWSDVSGEAVLLMHAGDRLCAGGVAALLDGLKDSDVVLGGYRIAGAGQWGIDVTPPKLTGIADLAAWAVAPPFELAAMALRRSALPAESQVAPGLPGGEVAILYAALSSSPNGRVATVNDIVAEVRARPVHLGEPTAMLERLRGVISGPLGSDPMTASRVRRRALSLAYLESNSLVAGQFDSDTWWGPVVESPDALTVFRDLHWALTCMAEAGQIASIGLASLADHVPSDTTSDMPPDVANMTATIASFQVLVGELTDTTHWLHAEVKKRDDQLSSVGSLHELIAELNATVTWLHEEVRLRDEEIVNLRGAK